MFIYPEPKIESHCSLFSDFVSCCNKLTSTWNICERMPINYKYIYIYIYSERESERERERDQQRRRERKKGNREKEKRA